MGRKRTAIELVRPPLCPPCATAVSFPPAPRVRRDARLVRKASRADGRASSARRVGALTISNEVKPQRSISGNLIEQHVAHRPQFALEAMAFAQQDRVGKRASVREFIEAQRDQRAVGGFGQMLQRILAGDDLDADGVARVPRALRAPAASAPAKPGSLPTAAPASSSASVVQEFSAKAPSRQRAIRCPLRRRARPYGCRIRSCRGRASGRRARPRPA